MLLSVMGFLQIIKKAWRGIQVDDRNDRRTRYVLTLWASFLISSMIIACFVASIVLEDGPRALAFIELIRDMIYVEASIIGAYFGFESILPSDARPYTSIGGFVAPEKTRKEPPVHPTASDADVQ